MKKLFVLKGKPGKTLLFSFLVTFFALMITWSTVSIIVKIDAKKELNRSGVLYEQEQLG